MVLPWVWAVNDDRVTLDGSAAKAGAAAKTMTTHSSPNNDQNAIGVRWFAADLRRR